MNNWSFTRSSEILFNGSIFAVQSLAGTVPFVPTWVRAWQQWLMAVWFWSFCCKCKPVHQCFQLFCCSGTFRKCLRFSWNPLQWSQLQPHRTVVAKFAPCNFGLFRRNLWQPLAEPCGSAEPRLENTAVDKSRRLWKGNLAWLAKSKTKS